MRTDPVDTAALRSKILPGFPCEQCASSSPFQDSCLPCVVMSTFASALLSQSASNAYRRKSDVTPLHSSFENVVSPQDSSVRTVRHSMVVGKHEIESALRAEKQEINAGRLREDSPLDESQGFKDLCMACRRGDLKACQEKIAEGVNVNARDRFDYTPLNLSSLCGHFEVVRLLLESGALCERDTFEGERCLCR